MPRKDKQNLEIKFYLFINKELKNIFKTKEFAISDFILRYVKKDQKRLKPIILHQENFMEIKHGKYL